MTYSIVKKESKKKQLKNNKKKQILKLIARHIHLNKWQEIQKNLKAQM